MREEDGFCWMSFRKDIFDALRSSEFFEPFAIETLKRHEKMSQKTQAKPYGCEVGGLCHRRAAGLIAGACQGVERFDSTGI